MSKVVAALNQVATYQLHMRCSFNAYYNQGLKIASKMHQHVENSSVNRLWQRDFSRINKKNECLIIGFEMIERHLSII